MTRTAAEVQVSVEVAAGYRSMAARLERDPLTRKLPLTVRRLARIARRAAISEELHPDSPKPGRCSICGRTQSCLAVN